MTEEKKKFKDAYERFQHKQNIDLCLSSGERLKKARNENGYSQYGLSQLVKDRGLRCSQNYIGQLERGSRNMSEKLAICFGKILHVSADYLLCKTSFETNEKMLEAIVDYAFTDHRTDEEKAEDHRYQMLAEIMSNFGFEVPFRFNSDIGLTDEDLVSIEAIIENEGSTLEGSTIIEVSYKDLKDYLDYIYNLMRFTIKEFIRVH